MKYLFTLSGWTCFSVPAKTRGREKLAKFTNYRFKTLSEKFYKVLLKLARNVCELLNFYRTQLKEVWKHGFTVLQAGHTICFWKLVCKLRYWLWPSEAQYNINRCSAKTATKTSFKKLKMANWAALQLATFVFLKQRKKIAADPAMFLLLRPLHIQLVLVFGLHSISIVRIYYGKWRPRIPCTSK